MQRGKSLENNEGQHQAKCAATWARGECTARLGLWRHFGGTLPDCNDLSGESGRWPAGRLSRGAFNRLYAAFMIMSTWVCQPTCFAGGCHSNKHAARRPLSLCFSLRSSHTLTAFYEVVKTANLFSSQIKPFGKGTLFYLGFSNIFDYISLSQ